MPCGVCKQIGHNSRTCKSELALPELFDAQTLARFELSEPERQLTKECIICCDEIKDECVKIKCGHTYCVTCFVKDMRERGNCAMCRSEVCEMPPKKTLSHITRSGIIDQWLENSQQIADTIRTEFIEQMRANIDMQRIIRTEQVNLIERAYINSAIGTDLTFSMWNAGIVASEYTSYWYESDA
jgi:hypothetical protein